MHREKIDVHIPSMKKYKVGKYYLEDEKWISLKKKTK